jgi:hypothetical protein
VNCIEIIGLLIRNKIKKLILLCLGSHDLSTFIQLLFEQKKISHIQYIDIPFPYVFHTAKDITLQATPLS